MHTVCAIKYRAAPVLGLTAYVLVQMDRLCATENKDSGQYHCTTRSRHGGAAMLTQLGVRRLNGIDSPSFAVDVPLSCFQDSCNARLLWRRKAEQNSGRRPPSSCRPLFRYPPILFRQCAACFLLLLHSATGGGSRLQYRIHTPCYPSPTQRSWVYRYAGIRDPNFPRRQTWSLLDVHTLHALY